MSQVDSRNFSAAGKRARTDGGRREDDWTCPSCGNINFSFRTTCNMRNCTQSRPADHNAKPGAKPLQPPPAYASAGYMGSGAPSSMYLGAPPYGSSLLNGSAMPPYNLPFSGGSGYHYDYGNRFSVGSPYGPLHMSGPPSYSSGSMMGTGGMYGMHPLMDRYGMSMPMGPGSMGPRPGSYPDDSSQKRNAGRESDWACPNCGNNNFSFRTVCNMRKCNTPRPGTQASKSENSKSSKPKMPEGSWKCEKCNNINYPFRTKCNRQNCGAEKPADANNSGGLASEDDDKDDAGIAPWDNWAQGLLPEKHCGEHQLGGAGGSKSSRNIACKEWTFLIAYFGMPLFACTTLCRIGIVLCTSLKGGWLWLARVAESLQYTGRNVAILS